MESAWPRTIAASAPLSFRGGSGRRALPATIPGRSAAKATSSSRLRAIARRHPVTARLNGSVGDSFDGLLGLMFDDITGSQAWQIDSTQRHIDRRFRQLDSETALIELGYDRSFQLVALVEKRQPEGETDVLEDVGVLRPHDHRARAHHRRNIAVHEGVAREVGDSHHFAHDVTALVGAVV